MTTEEIWKTITTHPLYELSNLSNVRNKRTLKHLKRTKKIDVVLYLSGIKTQLSVAKLMRTYFPELLDLPDEIWKDVPDFPYEASNLGRVKSKYTKDILDPSPNAGYLNTTGGKRLHILIAMAWIPNPDNKPYVNHIDNDGTNNRVDNLEWSTESENILHAVKIGALNSFNRMAIIRIDPETMEKEQFNSLVDAAVSVGLARTDGRLIKKACGDNKNTFKGYKWEFVNPPKKFMEELDLEGEIWKNIPETNYKVSTFSRVKNKTKKTLLKPFLNRNGYYYLTLHGKNIRLNILVAQAFIPNPDNLPIVDHIDRNPKNNHVSNLRWVTVQRNTRLAIARPIIQMTTDGDFIQCWECVGDIEKELGLGNMSIRKACNNEENHTYRGFDWMYFT